MTSAYLRSIMEDMNFLIDKYVLEAGDNNPDLAVGSTGMGILGSGVEGQDMHMQVMPEQAAI